MRKPLDVVDPKYGYRFSNLPPGTNDSDGLFMVVAFSGGGDATALNRGSDFQFTQDQFDPMCTDLSSLPLARAVAASSAMPILFGPVVLKNHGGRCGYKHPGWSLSRFSRCNALGIRCWKTSLNSNAWCKT